MPLFHGFGYCAVIATAITIAGCRSVQRSSIISDRANLRSNSLPFHGKMDTASMSSESTECVRSESVSPGEFERSGGT